MVSGGLSSEDVIKLTHLNLSRNKLSFLSPNLLSYFKQIKTLSLECNQLTSLPNNMNILSSLRDLRLQYNMIEGLPRSINQNLNLTSVDLSINQLNSLPSSFDLLTSLKCLAVSHNKLIHLNRNVLKSMNALELLDLSFNFLEAVVDIGLVNRLTSLNLSNNLISQIPNEIFSLSHLITLDLSSNLLTSIPSSIGEIKSLVKLNCSYNPISALPLSFTKLTNLEVLNVNHLLIASFPQFGNDAALKEISASFNHFPHFPFEVMTLPQLRSFTLKSNFIKSIPPVDQIVAMHQRGLEHFDITDNLWETNFNSQLKTATAQGMDAVISLLQSFNSAPQIRIGRSSMFRIIFITFGHYLTLLLMGETDIKSGGTFGLKCKF
jgi:leucine-rich repeat protein SHOC2